MSYPASTIAHMFDQAGVDAIESVIRDLAPGDVKRIPDEDLERGIVTLQRVIDRLQVERLRLVAEVNRRRSFARDGFVSAGAWLAQKSGTTFGTAKRDVVMARALEDMPRTRQALETGGGDGPVRAQRGGARRGCEAAPRRCPSLEALRVGPGGRRGCGRAPGRAAIRTKEARRLPIGQRHGADGRRARSRVGEPRRHRARGPHRRRSSGRTRHANPCATASGRDRGDLPGLVGGERAFRRGGHSARRDGDRRCTGAGASRWRAVPDPRGRSDHA